MKRIWDRIHVWLAANAPHVLASLRPGASEEQLRAAEATMGCRLPDDVRAAYRIHDGQEHGHDLLYGRWWGSLENVVEWWQASEVFADRTPPTTDRRRKNADKPLGYFPPGLDSTDR
jgi:cell wall assembly regulator SMI1